MMDTTQIRPLTGRRVTVWFFAFFGVVIAINLVMARLALGTFGGVVVDNSYVASQQFNRWLDAEAAQRKLGWQATAKRLPDGRVAVSFTGTKGAALTLSGEARHPLGRQPDRMLAFVPAGGGSFVTREPLPAGRWRLRLAAHTAEAGWRSELDLP
jgi:nitrogen fixation protein FixH